MTENMQQFVNHLQDYPEKLDAVIRKGHFSEIFKSFSRDRANQQAARCAQCGIPFCQIHCPVSNNIPDWLMAVANNRLEDAWQLLNETNSLPEICGRICPQDRLCEGNCVIEQSGHGAVTIGSIETYINETAWQKGWIKPIKPQTSTGFHVAIIGAGPGGLSCAQHLRKNGHQVTIFDRYDRAGGMMIYGIPNFKLDKKVVMRRVQWLKDSNVDFKLNINVGTDISFEQILDQFDGVVIACGAYKARTLSTQPHHAQGVHLALDYLRASNRKGLGDHIQDFEDGTLNAAGHDVVVVGGGDTAMDCVRTAIRQQAKSVRCIYRRDQNNMPGSKKEVTHAIEEGVDFKWLYAPTEIKTNGSNHVELIKIQKMRLSSPDASGRRAVQLSKQKPAMLPASMVLLALGFEVEDNANSLNAPQLNRTRWGTVALKNDLGQTNIEKVFAIGDVVRGPSLVVWAVYDGQRAADAVHQYLCKKVKSRAA
ncbi:MAG: NAD(P)-dependent oxidoreductase [Pseudomonadota bacterium]